MTDRQSMQRRLTCSQTMSCLKYLTTSDPILKSAMFPSGSGTYWCMYATGGGKSFLHHHSVLISDFSAHTKHLSGRVWVSGQLYLSSLTMTVGGTSNLTAKTMSLLHWNTPVVYASSSLR